MISTADNDRPLRRHELAEFLTHAGYRISQATLSTLATRGGGPPMTYWGRLPLYDRSAALAWAKTRAGEPVTSTAEWRARHQSEAAA
jgi:hypothetical protein